MVPITEQIATLTRGQQLLYGARGPTPATVVFIHGWPDSWRSFEPVMDALPVDTGAISVSLPGFGGSDPGSHGFTPDDFVVATRELLERLEITSAVFVGHSMGSLVVQRLVAQQPTLAAGMALIGGFNRLPDDAFAEVMSAVQDIGDPVDEQFVREFQSSTLAAPVPAAFFDQLVAESRKAPAAVWRAAWVGSRSMPPLDETTITAPTLLLWGDQDALVPRAEQEALLAAIPGARLQIYEGAGHSPNWERPEQVASDITKFMREVGAT
jgi:pimeloyl-ACP methyl ester carboxylesterase